MLSLLLFFDFPQHKRAHASRKTETKSHRQEQRISNVKNVEQHIKNEMTAHIIFIATIFIQLSRRPLHARVFAIAVLACLHTGCNARAHSAWVQTGKAQNCRFKDEKSKMEIEMQINCYYKQRFMIMVIFLAAAHDACSVCGMRFTAARQSSGSNYLFIVNALRLQKSRKKNKQYKYH